MIRYLVILAVVAAPMPAQAQQTRLTYSVDCVRARIPCNGTPHASVTEGLKAREGSAMRFQAEICRALPGADQEACMAQVREEPRRASRVREISTGNPAAAAGDSSRCDFIGPLSRAEINGALERCEVATVLTDGKSIPYRRPAPRAREAASAHVARPTVEAVKAQVAAMLKDTDSARFGEVYAKVVRETYAVCGHVNGRNSVGGYAKGMKFVAVDGMVYLIEGSDGNAAGRLAHYEFCDD